MNLLHRPVTFRAVLAYGTNMVLLILVLSSGFASTVTWK